MAKLPDINNNNIYLDLNLQLCVCEHFDGPPIFSEKDQTVLPDLIQYACGVFLCQQAAWMLLAEAAPSCNLFDASLVTDAWQRYSNNDITADSSSSEISPATLQRILSVMGSIHARIDETIRMELIDDLKARLLKFDASTELIGSMISALNKVHSLWNIRNWIAHKFWI